MTTFKRAAALSSSMIIVHPFLRRRRAFLPWFLLLSMYTLLVWRFFDDYIYNINNEPPPRTPGIIILGMHRSSTSMLSGLLIQGLGYNIGGPSLPAAADNPKGFFERGDVVDMNNIFLNSQGTTWDNNDKIGGYNTSLTEKQLQSEIQVNETFAEILDFYNGDHKVPYLHKDPRTCLTLPVWLKHLNHRPAILFTYRNPLEVAMSLQKREYSLKQLPLTQLFDFVFYQIPMQPGDNFPLFKGLQLWTIYNVYAIQYSNGYCRVVTSSDGIVRDTLKEIARTTRELTSRCHIIPSPNATLTFDVVDAFVDHSLQHNTNGHHLKRQSNATILHDFGNGCVANKLISDHADESEDQLNERHAYLIAMKLYCDMQSGMAFDYNYEMPAYYK